MKYFLPILIFLFSSCVVDNVLSYKRYEIPAVVEYKAKTQFYTDYSTVRIIEVPYDGKLYQYMVKDNTLTFHKCIRLRTNYAITIITTFISTMVFVLLIYPK